MRKKDKLNETSILLKKMFPEIPEDKLIEIDMEIKREVNKYRYNEVTAEISKIVQKDILGNYIKCSNTKKVKKKLHKLIQKYRDNAEQLELQENWLGLLAYFATIISLFLDTGIIKTNCYQNFVIYFAIFGIWSVIIKCHFFKNAKMKIILRSFNKSATSFLVITCLIYYGIECYFEYYKMLRIFCVTKEHIQCGLLIFSIGIICYLCIYDVKYKN